MGTLWKLLENSLRTRLQRIWSDGEALGTLWERVGDGVYMSDVAVAESPPGGHLAGFLGFPVIVLRGKDAFTKIFLR